MSSSSILLSAFGILLLFGVLTSTMAGTVLQWVVVAAVVLVGLQTAAAMGKKRPRRR